MRATLGVVILAALCACRGDEGRGSGAARVLTPFDYLAAGVDGVRRFHVDGAAGRRDPDDRLGTVAQRVEEAVVLVEIDRPIGPDRSTQTLATGVLLDGGRTVATAGHALSDVRETDSVRLRIGGRKGTVDVAIADVRFDRLQRDAVDLGFADLSAPADAPELAIEAPEVGELLVGLAFPEGIGATSSGTLQHARPGGAALRPLPMIVEVESVEPLRLRLVAGSMPLRGASGAPFFDRDGHCVCVLSRVEAVFDGEQTRSTIAASPLMGARSAR